MKSLNLSIELSNLALESISKNMTQHELLDRVHGVLLDHSDELGELTGSSESHKSLGSDIQLNEYRFDFGRHSVQVQLANFLPHGDWQVQGVRLV